MSYKKVLDKGIVLAKVCVINKGTHTYIMLDTVCVCSNMSYSMLEYNTFQNMSNFLCICFNISIIDCRIQTFDRKN